MRAFILIVTPSNLVYDLAMKMSHKLTEDDARIIMDAKAEYDRLKTEAEKISPKALADKFDACPDPEAARRCVKSCLQENPYNTQVICEARAPDKFCGSKQALIKRAAMTSASSHQQRWCGGDRVTFAA